MSAPRALLDELLDAVRVHSATSHSWFGRRVMEPGTADTPVPGATVGPRLRARLYGSFYVTGGPVPDSARRSVVFGIHATPWTDLLSDANRGHGCRQAGWSVAMLDDGLLAVEREGLRVWGTPEELGVASPCAVGDEVAITFPKESWAASLGFYTALGDHELEDVPVDRHYWNLRPEGAPLLIREATTALNEAGVAFRLKVVDARERFVRRDAGVLYTRAADRAGVRPLVFAIHQRLRGFLRPGAPALTESLAPGLGFAEDPGGNESFGFHRCGLLADALIRAQRRGAESAVARMEVIAERFAEAGIEMDRPFLNPVLT